MSGWQPRPKAPYGPGNLAALKHGAHSPRTLRTRAAEIAEQLAALAPWCALAPFRSALDDLAFGLAQLEVLRDDMDARGLLDDARHPVGSANFHSRVQSTVHRLRGELGLSPSSWAKLVARLGTADGDAVAHGIAALQEIGRELDRTMRALPGADDD
jgi:hypothetical protein